MTCTTRANLIQLEHPAMVRMLTYEAPNECNRGPTAEPMRHFKSIMMPSTSLGVCEHDNAKEESYDDIREDERRDGDLADASVSALQCRPIISSGLTCSFLMNCRVDCAAKRMSHIVPLIAAPE